MRKRAVRRRRAREAALAFGAGGVDEAVSPGAAAGLQDDELRRALSELPERRRTAIVLRHYLDLSETDTADLMECSVGTVKAAASRGRSRLAEILREGASRG